LDLGYLFTAIGIPIILFILGKFMPNSWFKKHGESAGRWFSKRGRGVVGIGAWEKLENTLSGAFLAFAEGFQEGADQDDNNAEHKASKKGEPIKGSNAQFMPRVGLIILVSLALLMPAISHAQGGVLKVFTEPPEKVHYAILANLSQFYFNGDFRAFETPLAGGIRYDVNSYFSPGLFIAPAIKREGDSDFYGDVSAMVHFNLFGRLGLGFGGRFWFSKPDGGIISPFKKNNAFFTINLDLATTD